MPPILDMSLSFSRDKFSNSFFDRLFFELLSLSIISNSSNLFIDLEIVFQLVSVPPSHLLFTKYCCVSKDNSFTIFEHCFLVPTINTLPDLDTIS